MPATLRVPAPAALRRLIRPVRYPTGRAATAAVAAAAVASAVVLFAFVARHGCRVPFGDEYANLGVLLAPDLRFAPYWAQHNEHRVPLPRLAYVAAVRTAGYDFRAPLYLDAALLTGAAAVLLAAIRRVRGRTVLADAFIPLTVLGVGGWENLVSAFQVQFVLSTVFGLLLVALLLPAGFDTSCRRPAAVGLLLALLPLCGANGVALVPPVALGLAAVGARGLAARDPARRRPGWVALAAAGVGFAVTAAYFHGLQKAAHHPPPPGAAAVGVTAVNFLGLAAGPVTAAMHPFGYDGPAVLGVVVTALVAATLGLLAVRLGRPEERTRAVLAGGLLVGWLGLAGGLAYGRAGLGNVLLVSRYVTLAMPVLVLAYFVWTALGGRVGGRVVPAGLALLAVLTAVPNHRRASADAGIHASRVRKVEREIRAGVPIGFVADGNRYVLPLEPWHFRQSMEFLRDHGVRPFADLRPDSPLSATDLPFAVTTEGPVTEQGGSFAVGRGIGTVVLRLPRPVRAYALALTYEAVSPGPHLPAMVSWDAGGRAPPAPGKGVLDQLMPTAGPLTTRVLVDAEVDALRLDICGPGTRITLHKLAVLGRTD